MKKTDITVDPQYYTKYINLIEDIELSDAFNNILHELKSINLSELEQLGDQVYAEGKWTIKDIIQHVIDAERILSYRALRFARKDPTPTEGFEQEDYARFAKADRRTVRELIDELTLVTNSTKVLFDTFDEEQLNNKGFSWQYEMSVLAMGFAIVGHHIHHFNIIKEKYLPLLQKA